MCMSFLFQQHSSKFTVIAEIYDDYEKYNFSDKKIYTTTTTTTASFNTFVVRRGEVNGNEVC